MEMYVYCVQSSYNDDLLEKNDFRFFMYIKKTIGPMSTLYIDKTLKITLLPNKMSRDWRTPQNLVQIAPFSNTQSFLQFEIRWDWRFCNFK